MSRGTGGFDKSIEKEEKVIEICYQMSNALSWKRAMPEKTKLMLNLQFGTNGLF